MRYLLFGVRTRFLLGALLLGVGLWWLRQNPKLGNQVYDLFTHFTLPREWEASAPFSFMNLPPENIGQLMFNSFNAGVAGLLLILSTFFSSRKAIAGFYLGGLFVFLGQWGLPLGGIWTVEVPMWGTVTASLLSLAGGTALAALSFVFAILFDRD